MMEVLNQHISSKPEAPRFKNPMISPTLENLILSLLEKNPAKRPASGSVVACTLSTKRSALIGSSVSTPGGGERTREAHSIQPHAP